MARGRNDKPTSPNARGVEMLLNFLEGIYLESLRLDCEEIIIVSTVREEWGYLRGILKSPRLLKANCRYFVVSPTLAGAIDIDTDCLADEIEIQTKGGNDGCSAR